MWMTLGDYRMLQKSKSVCKREFNNIFGWLRVLVYSLKRFRA